MATNADICMTSSYWLRPVVQCLPAWFRFAQCLRRYRDTRDAFPHLVNAGKYSTTFFVVLFSALNSSHTDPTVPNPTYNAFFYFWIVFSVISSLYAYTWDIKMDWGLLDKDPKENKFLREEIVYSSRGYYYFAIIEDFVLRFAWAISLSLTELENVNGDLLTSILSPLEVFRRFVWNFFRLENEHLNNCGMTISSFPGSMRHFSFSLRRIPSGAGHFGGADRRLRPRRDHPHDGRGGRGHVDQEEQEGQ